MGKYSRDLDETLEKKVKDIAAVMGFKEQGITIETARIKKSKTYGEILKPNELAKMFLGSDDDDTIVVALYEELFDMVTDEVQNYWIESLLHRVWYNSEKEKVEIIKPEIALSVGMYHKFKEIAVQNEELAYLTIQQMEQKRKEEKEAKKAEKAAKKANKS